MVNDRLMLRTALRAKIHRAIVTETHLHYEGSVTVDSALLEAADIREFEQVHIYDVNNGARFVTYAIAGPANSGVICMNGAGARLVATGDLIIICSYAQYDEAEFRNLKPRVVLVDAENRVTIP